MDNSNLDLSLMPTQTSLASSKRSEHHLAGSWFTYSCSVSQAVEIRMRARFRYSGLSNPQNESTITQMATQAPAAQQIPVENVTISQAMVSPSPQQPEIMAEVEPAAQIQRLRRFKLIGRIGRAQATADVLVEVFRTQSHPLYAGEPVDGDFITWFVRYFDEEIADRNVWTMFTRAIRPQGGECIYNIVDLPNQQLALI